MQPIQGILQTKDYEHFSVRSADGSSVASFDGAAAANKALPGDLVSWDGATATLVSRAPFPPLVGTLELNSKSRYGITSRGVLRYMFLPFSEAYPPFFVGCSSRDTSRNLLVRIQFDSWPASSTCPIGTLTQTFGPAGDLRAEEEALLAHYAPVRWKATDTLPCLGTGLEGVATVVDATQLDTFHIDPPGCRDIDDAISFQSVGMEGGYEVHIHIADVASWIHAYPQMAEKAAEIGQTLYRDGVAVRPMFPAAFSEGHMSLLPGEIRTAWTFVFPWDAERRVVGLAEGRWERQRICVKGSYTYETARESPWAGLLQRLTSGLVNRPVTDPHEWVEQLMLLYNRAAAAMLKRVGSGVLRRHAGPDVDRFEAMRASGLPASACDRLGMRAGEYCLATEEGVAHWGLGAAVYCHASSPIRRWSDCINQLVLAGIIQGVVNRYGAAGAKEVEALNAAGKRAKGYERDIAYVRILLAAGGGVLVREAVVVEEGRIYISSWERIVRADTGEIPPGTEVSARIFADASKRNWKRRLVVSLNA